MRTNILITLTALLITSLSFAQAPDQLSYQAVIRDNAGILLSNQTVGMQIEILQGSIAGTVVYEETHMPTTNANGLVTLQIGAGTVVSGDFATIDWSNGPYFTRTSTDPAGGTNYTIQGTSELLSVAYALYAKTAAAVDNLKTYVVGEFVEDLGGVVAYVDESGQHGFVVDVVNRGNAKWFSGVAIQTGATADGIYAGAKNTSIIVAAYYAASANVATVSDDVVSSVDFGTPGITPVDAVTNVDFATPTTTSSPVVASVDFGTPGTGTTQAVTSASLEPAYDGGVFAAEICHERLVGLAGPGSRRLGDYYLPSLEEFEVMRDNLIAINATLTSIGGNTLTSNFFWTSYERRGLDGLTEAFSFNFGSGPAISSKTSEPLVRCVRRF